jgi:hypothetical protein
LQPSNHTRLMNAIIGMCKKNINWVSVLADLGYDIQIIEQTMNTSTGDAVKPDVVAASNQLLHSLVFDAKGGITIDPDQLRRYSTMKPEDLRWVSVWDRQHLQFNVCICDLLENHNLIKMSNTAQFPMLTFGSEILSKEGKFNVQKLNEVFQNPIDLTGKLPPLSYYPFSDMDETPYIAMHVIRAILSITMKNIKSRSSEISEEKIITFDEVVATKFNPVWKALSSEHKKALKAKIIEVIKRTLADEKVKEHLGIIQLKKGYKITRNLEQFKIAAEQLIEDLQSQTTLGQF